MKFSKTQLDIVYMKINSVGSLCNVSMSQSEQRSHFAVSKKTEGFGEESGDGNQYWQTVSFVDDEDFSDSETFYKKD
ncbi:MAG TPA: hypothetical protein VFK37_02310 [Bacillales bacterium]|nr:hypothetical protein [Bacillales bacterium]